VNRSEWAGSGFISLFRTFGTKLRLSQEERVKDNEERESFVVHIKPRRWLVEMTDEEIDGFVDDLWGALAKQSKQSKDGS
jgi:hypothetical protein